jgi:predicted secreted Zn-dependent protease
VRDGRVTATTLYSHLWHRPHHALSTHTLSCLNVKQAELNTLKYTLPILSAAAVPALRRHVRNLMRKTKSNMKYNHKIYTLDSEIIDEC